MKFDSLFWAKISQK